jgi:peptidoglycan/xylan/chitin deacetylase (PgdA/CDA1 family)
MSLRKRLLVSFAALLYYSGFIAIARWLTARQGQRLIILNYHRAADGNLRQHLCYLCRHYRIVPIEDALEELYAPHTGKSRRRGRIPLVLTFDDGYQDNYTYALPLAQELRTPFTVYLVPGYIDSGEYFWWFEGKRLVERAQVREATVEGALYRLDKPAERQALSTLIDTRLRYASSVAEREAFLTKVRAILQISADVLEQEKPLMPLTWEQVHEMQQSGMVYFGAHTMHHPILSYLSDAEERKREITECRAVLKQRLGEDVRTFAYPVGQEQHIGDETYKAVRQAGFAWAVTTHYGFNTPQTDPWRLRRIEADVDQHWLVLAAEAAGVWGLISRLRWLPIVRKNFTNSR